MGQPASTDVEASPAAELVPVTLGLCDGGTRVGAVRRFSPYGPFVTLWEGLGRTDDISEVARETRVSRIDSGSIAYVAFESEDGGPAARSRPSDPVDLRILLAGGASLLVRASKATLRQTIGFYADPLPENQESPRRFFIFARAIEAKEVAAPIGAMLVERGLIDADQLPPGLDVQQDERRKPIGQILAEFENVSQTDIQRARMLQERRHVRIGDALVEEGLVTPEDIEAALAEQRKRRGKRLGEILVELGLVSELDLYFALGKKFQMPVIDIDEAQIDPAVFASVSPDIIRTYCVLPVHVDDRMMMVGQQRSPGGGGLRRPALPRVQADRRGAGAAVADRPLHRKTFRQRGRGRCWRVRRPHPGDGGRGRRTGRHRGQRRVRHVAVGVGQRGRGGWSTG